MNDLYKLQYWRALIFICCLNALGWCCLGVAMARISNLEAQLEAAR